MSTSSSGKVLNKIYGRLSSRPQVSGKKKKRKKLQPLRRSDEYMVESEAAEEEEAILWSESHQEDDSSSGGGEEEGAISSSSGSPAPQKKTGSTLSISSQKMMSTMFVASCVVASGLGSYLTSPIGGGQTKTFVNNLGKNVLNLISFTKEALDGTGLDMVDDKTFVADVWSTALIIATGETSAIADHLDALKTNKGLKDNTLRGHVATFKLFFYWFAYVFKGKDQFPINTDDKKKLEVVFCNLSKFYSKAAKVVRRKERQSIEEKVALKSWPDGGFGDLQKCLIPHIKDILAMDPDKIRIDEESYRHIKQVLLAGTYSFSVQGRAGGVKSILLRQAPDLIENGNKGTLNFYLIS